VNYSKGQRGCGRPESKLSLQRHFHRSEHWVVVKGTAEITLGNDVRNVHENESVYIPSSSARQSWQEPARADRSAGRQLSRQDNIVRFDDVYGRG
jgi:mannose-1-phosphate guanylyltransferase/mannose-6-phosphate isomerase